MKKLLFFIAMAVLIAWPIPGDAASIKNDDKEIHLIKVRIIGGGYSGGKWVYVEVSPNGSKFFNCRFGCELVLEKTGSAVQLETDADVVIKKGELIVK